MPNPKLLSAAQVAVIGGGPAGLMAADVLSAAGAHVTIYDAMPSVGRKFLMAGKGGMNISNAEPFTQFVQRYGTQAENMHRLLSQFTPDDLQAWLRTLGIETFTGTSGRIFPSDMKAAPLLRAWLHQLRNRGVTIQVRQQWLGWVDKQLHFSNPSGKQLITADAVILALGGGSWAKFGSTGAWVDILRACEISVAPLQPANCGFEVPWSNYIKQGYAGEPLKSIAANLITVTGKKLSQNGELMLTDYGVEGGLIYALSAPLRELINQQGKASINLDLLPALTEADIARKLASPRHKNSFANHLRKTIGLTGAKASLLRENLNPDALSNPAMLASSIKNLAITLTATRPIDEAISTAGGVRFDTLNEHLMLQTLPGVFCAGEMLDWEAPTGGYLLSACFATGRVAGLGALNWLQTQKTV